METGPDYSLEPLTEPFRLEDVTFAVLHRLPKASREDRALVESLYDQAARIQGLCWHEPPFEWVPPHCLQALDAIGACTLAAYVRVQGRPRLIGMVCEMPAFEWVDGSIRPFLYSHLMAVSGADHLPIGYELKKRQRREALARGITTLRWTYDPLQSLNANINIRKCGATCGTYKPAAYSLVGINAGVDADRFYVTWDLTSPRVRERMEAEPPTGLLARLDEDLRATLAAVPCVNWTAVDPLEPSFRVVTGQEADLDAPVLSLEIPVHFQALIDRGRAQPWRACTREVFQAYFRRGYRVQEFVLAPDEEIPGARRAFYLLERQP